MAYTVPWHLIGLQISGDIGPYTIYTDRHARKVVFPKAPPKEPPSEFQIDLRARFKSAQAEYMAQTDQVKAEIEAATKKLSIPLTGQNLWISIAMKANFEVLQTIRDQSGINLATPTAV